jgi:putative DNA primase/helicase
VFAEVAATRFGSQRDGDQYGTLLAGAWALLTDEPATRANAEELIDSFDWSEHRDGADEDDSQRALAALMNAVIRLDGNGTSTPFELISIEAGRYDGARPCVDPEEAARKLGQIGIKVSAANGKTYLYLANSNAERDKLLTGTKFGIGLKDMLLRLKGAGYGSKVTGTKTTRFPGLPPQGFYVIPLGVVFGDPPEMDF